MARRKTFEELDFTDDFLFCKILSNNLEITRRLLEVILGVPIRNVSLVEAQKSIDITPYAHGVRFDVYVEDEDETVFDIDIQTYQSSDLGRRMRYYQGMIDLNMLDRGEPYQMLKKSYVIFICTRRPFDKNLPKYTFTNQCSEDSSIQLGDDATKVILNAEGPVDGVSEDLRAFLHFLRSHTVTDPFTSSLQKEVNRAKESREWRLDYMTLEMKLRESFDEGLQKAKIDGLLSIMRNLHLDLEEAMDALSIADSDKKMYRKKIREELDQPMP